MEEWKFSYHGDLPMGEELYTFHQQRNKVFYL